MELIKEFLNTYGLSLFYAAFTAVAAFAGAKIKKAVESWLNTKEKRAAAETVVRAVEQLYHDLDGAGKLAKAQEGVIEILESKGITITDIELRLLIESVVATFNYNFNGGGGKEVTDGT